MATPAKTDAKRDLIEDVGPQPRTKTDAKKAAFDPEVPEAERTALEDYQRTFNARWDAANDSIVDEARPEILQVRGILEPHLSKYLGMGMHTYIVGMFIEKDLPGRQAMGYQILRWPDLSSVRDSAGNPVWSDAIAQRMGLLNHADGTIRWGRRGENLVCAIESGWRERKQQRDREAAAQVERQRIMPGKITEDESADGSYHETVIERTREPRMRKGGPR